MVADEMIPTQFICVPTRIYPSLKIGCFWPALQLPCTALQKTDRQPKGCKRRFPWKWGMKVENQEKLKEKEPKINVFWLWVAEREGFEPSCAWAQTDSSQVSKNELNGIWWMIKANDRTSKSLILRAFWGFYLRKHSENQVLKVFSDFMGF